MRLARSVVSSSSRTPRRRPVPGGTESGQAIRGHWRFSASNYIKRFTRGRRRRGDRRRIVSAERLQLIRNHAEVVVRDKGTEDIANMIGFNYSHDGD